MLKSASIRRAIKSSMTSCRFADGVDRYLVIAAVLAAIVNGK